MLPVVSADLPYKINDDGEEKKIARGIKRLNRQSSFNGFPVYGAAVFRKAG